MAVQAWSISVCCRMPTSASRGAGRGGRTDLLGHDAGGVAVAPDALGHGDEPDGGQQARCAGIGGRGACRGDHELERLEQLGRIAVVGVLGDRADTDEDGGTRVDRHGRSP